MSDPRRIIDMAIEIAAELGDDFDAAPYDKAEWIKTRGGEPFRDVSLPFQCDYLAAAHRAYAIAMETQRAETENTGSVAKP